MSNSISFHIHCIPPKATAHQKGIVMIGGKPRMYKKKNVKEAEASLASLLALKRPEAPFKGPVRLFVKWTYPWRKAEPKKNRVKGYRFCDTRPDIDNLSKILCDTMTSLNYWGDDSQVASLSFEKFWGETPGISVGITELK